MHNRRSFLTRALTAVLGTVAYIYTCPTSDRPTV